MNPSDVPNQENLPGQQDVPGEADKLSQPDELSVPGEPDVSGRQEVPGQRDGSAQRDVAVQREVPNQRDASRDHAGRDGEDHEDAGREAPGHQDSPRWPQQQHEAGQPDRTVYRVDQAGLAWRAAGEELVVLDTTRSVYFGLDRSAALLWRHLVDGATVNELTDALVGAEVVDHERATDDVGRFLDQLRQHGLLQRS